MAGTLTIPDSAGPHPAVVLITGSGPRNRDEEFFGFKVFGVIADHLTRNGIAVLRYDDRGVGGSTGDVFKSTLDDFAGDVLAALELLKQHPDINSKQIGLIGHSEGGIIAPLVASQSNDVTFNVLIAGPGLPGDQIVRTQNELILRVGGATEAEIQRMLDLQARTIEAVATGQGWEQIEAEARHLILESVEGLPDNQRAAITDVDKFVTTVVEEQLQANQSPWFKSFIEHDPRPSLEQLTIPVLALFGELDLLVPAKMNEAAISEALGVAGNQDFSSVIFPQANHLFQVAKTGSPDEYAVLEKEFVLGFLDLITEWISERVQRP